MATAEIITIGTELLLGDITDTNAQYLAKLLNKEGFDVYRVTTVGDNVNRIARAMQEALARSDLVITTGGLGPTVDDPTREAAAKACGTKLVFHEELWEQINSRFQELGHSPTENNEKQAYLPEKAKGIRNLVGTAPAFYINQDHALLCCLPGVPSEMHFLMQNEFIPLYRQHFHTEAVLKTTVMHTIGIGESHIDQLIGHLEKLNNPTIGLAAHAGSVDIRITAKAKNQQKAAALIGPILEEINNSLGQYVFGYDETTIIEAIQKELTRKGFLQIDFTQQNLPFMDKRFQEITEKIQSDLVKNNPNNQYNKDRPRNLIIEVSSKELISGKELAVYIEDEKNCTAENYKFMNNPDDFEEWTLNKVMGLIFKHLDKKG